MLSIHRLLPEIMELLRGLASWFTPGEREPQATGLNSRACQVADVIDGESAVGPALDGVGGGSVMALPREDRRDASSQVGLQRARIRGYSSTIT